MITNEELMTALETSTKATALVTGMKQQLVDRGWSDAGAERVVIHWITNGNEQTP